MVIDMQRLPGVHKLGCCHRPTVSSGRRGGNARHLGLTSLFTLWPRVLGGDPATSERRARAAPAAKPLQSGTAPPIPCPRRGPSVPGVIFCSPRRPRHSPIPAIQSPPCRRPTDKPPEPPQTTHPLCRLAEDQELAETKAPKNGTFSSAEPGYSTTRHAQNTTNAEMSGTRRPGDGTHGRGTGRTAGGGTHGRRRDARPPAGRTAGGGRDGVGGAGLLYGYAFG
jgi:hypothetical protein